MCTMYLLCVEFYDDVVIVETKPYCVIRFTDKDLLYVLLLFIFLVLITTYAFCLFKSEVCHN